MASDSDDLSATQDLTTEPYYQSSADTMYKHDSNGRLNHSFDSHFTEEINIKMRIPEKLTVGEAGDNNELSRLSNNDNWYPMDPSYSMEVPSRIVVSGINLPPVPYS